MVLNTWSIIVFECHNWVLREQNYNVTWKTMLKVPMLSKSLQTIFEQQKSVNSNTVVELRSIKSYKLLTYIPILQFCALFEFSFKYLDHVENHWIVILRLLFFFSKINFNMVSMKLYVVKIEFIWKKIQNIPKMSNSFQTFI